MLPVPMVASYDWLAAQGIVHLDLALTSISPVGALSDTSIS